MQPRSARGFVLIASLLLLLVMTLLALAMFHSFGIQELVAGSVREKQRALQSAFAAEEYAEIWMTSYNAAQGVAGLETSFVQQCGTLGLVLYSTTQPPYLCSQTLSSVVANITSVPWKNTSGAEVGFTFFPGTKTGTGDMTVSTGGGSNSYYQVPRFYIGLVAQTPAQTMFRIDAWNWGGTTNTAAVVEATYLVSLAPGGAASASGL